MQSNLEPVKEAAKKPKPGWLLGKPRGSNPQPLASEYNRRRWADNPKKLAETVRRMNQARLSRSISAESKARMSAAKKNAGSQCRSSIGRHN
jgi:hypothetical protein